VINMGVNYVRLANGEELIDLTKDTVTSQTLKAGETAHGANGELIVGELEDAKLKPLIVDTLSEAPQVITPEGDVDGFSQVTVDGIPSGYIGSGVTKKGAETFTPSESQQTIASDQYLSGVQTIDAIPSNYVGSGVPKKTAALYTPTKSQQTISAGQYLEGV
jgi:hypothetical protein